MMMSGGGLTPLPVVVVRTPAGEEPERLYGVLAAQGFKHELEPEAIGAWRVTSRRDGERSEGA